MKKTGFPRKQGEEIIIEIPHVEASDGTNSLADSTIFITTHRLFAFLASQKNKVNFEIKSTEIEKPQQKLEKNQLTEKSKAICRLLLKAPGDKDSSAPAKRSLLFTFVGTDCNDRCKDFIEHVKKFQKTEPPPEIPVFLPISLTIPDELKTTNPIFSYMCNDKRYKSVLDVSALSIFNRKYVEIFAKHLNEKVGYSGKDLVLESQRGDTSAGANSIIYSLDKQIIWQLLRRLPKLKVLYDNAMRAGKTQSEFFNKDYLEFLKENAANDDKGNKEFDIIKSKPNEEEQRLLTLDEKARIDNLYDEVPAHGLMKKEEMKPRDQDEFTLINTHSQLALMAHGTVPDTTVTPDQTVKYEKTPIDGAKNLEDLSDKPVTEFDALVVNEESVPKEVLVDDTTDDEWTTSIKAFDRQLEGLQEKRTENPNSRLTISETGCRNVLYEMGYDRKNAHIYDEGDNGTLLEIAKKTAVLQILASTYWDAVNTKKEGKMDEVRSIIAEHKAEVDQFFSTLDNEKRNKFGPLFENVNEMYKAILNGSEQVKKEEARYDSIIRL